MAVIGPFFKKDIEWQSKATNANCRWSLHGYLLPSYFVRGSITVCLTSCMTSLDSTKLVNLYPIQHKQSS